MKGVTATALGLHLGMKRQSVSELAERGVLSALADGSFDLDASRLTYIAHLRGEQRHNTKSASASRVQDARAREIELRTAERDRRLIDTDEAIAALDEIVGPMKADLAGVGPRVTRDIDLRRRIESEHDVIFSRTAARLAERASALRKGGSASATDAEDDA